jgi:hypothetical protein
MQDAKTHFPEKLRLRAPSGLKAAVQLAAERNHTTPAEWARQAILRALAHDGVRLIAGKIEAATP